MADLQIKDTVTPTSQCCECGHAVDRAAGIGDSTPVPGDYSLCIRCACLNIFDENLAVLAPTDDEMFAAAVDPGVQKLRSLILDVNASFAGDA